VSLLYRDLNFEHWRDCRMVSDGCIELVVPRSFGPRVMGCGFAGGRNLFQIFPDEGVGVRVRGGHRLWVAPERQEVTWVKDNDPVELEDLEDGLRATGAVEPGTGLQKELILRFTSRAGELEVVHRVTNRNPWAIEFAAWALTQAAPGGIALCGFPPRGKHPEMLLPTNPLVMWAYTKLGDPRWQWGDKFFALRQDPDAAEPQKIGLFHATSWVAYLLGSDLFFKWSAADPTGAYPDFGCSLEIFTNRFMMELETLGPITKVEPNQTVEHIEHWMLMRNVALADLSDSSMGQALEPAFSRIPPFPGGKP
jgi:hypothetical protein